MTLIKDFLNLNKKKCISNLEIILQNYKYLHADCKCKKKRKKIIILDMLNINLLNYQCNW